MIMQKLKELTRPYHDQVENKAFADKIMDGSLSYAQYQELIYGNFLFHSVVETALLNGLPSHIQRQLQLSERLKKDILEKELTQMGMPTVDTSQLPKLVLDSMYEALGALYVMEGSTLGGAMIKKKLLKNAEIAQKAPLLFYGCYGEDTGKYWKAFMGVMHAISYTPQQEEEVVEAAIRSFNVFGQCLEAAQQGVNT